MSSKITARPKYIATTDARERAIITAQGLDPDRFRVKAMKAYVSANGEDRTSWQIELDKRVEAHEKEELLNADNLATSEANAEQFAQAVADCTKIIRQYKPPVFKGLVGHDAFTVMTSDWQVGKNERGVGSAETVRRYLDCLYQSEARVKMMRPMGYQMPTLLIASPGDLFEGCIGHYANQAFTVDLDRRAQAKVIRELLTKTIVVLGRHFDHIVVMAVGGNHGEHRGSGGKVITTMADNDDVAVFDSVREAFDLAGQKNIEWHIADHELSISREVAGVNVGLTHGHLFKGGSDAAFKWWRDQQFGREATADVDILLAGHKHSLQVIEYSAGRTFIQSPTIDPGSAWFTETSGISSTPGVLTFRLDHENPSKFDDLKLLVPSQPILEVAA